MRVANKTLFDSSRFRLGQSTEQLRDANEVISTQKRINNLSDDPVGLTQVLDLKSTLDNLEQLDKNVEVGKNWLNAQEAALDSIDDLIMEAKTLTSQMLNAAAGPGQRADAVEKVDSILDQIMSLGNTQMSGRYIFAGTDTGEKPFTLEENPRRVVYSGTDEVFTIKSGANQSVAVGRDGEKVFWDDQIEINSTNNTINFVEDIGRGDNYRRFLSVEVPDGTYTADELGLVVRNTMNDVSMKEGYGVTYDVVYDADSKKYTIKEDGSFDGYLQFEFKWDTGEDARIDRVGVEGNILLDDVHVNVNVGTNNEILSIPTPEPAGTRPLTLIWDGEAAWTVENNPGYIELPPSIQGTAESVDLDLDGNGAADIMVRLDHPAAARGDAVTFEIIPKTFDTSIGPDLGFKLSNVAHEPIRSDSIVTSLTDIDMDFTNNKVDFLEIDATGKVTPLTATILGPGGESAYRFTDPHLLAASVEKAMETASAAVLPFPPNPPIDYAVSYDPATSRFTVMEESSSLREVRMLWGSGTNALLGTSAGESIGFVNSDNASGSFGGDLLGTNNWDVNDTVTMRFSDGTNTLDYSRTILTTDTNAVIFEDIREQLATTFGDDGVFTVNGNSIDFSLAREREFTISQVTDDNASGTGNSAFVDVGVPNAKGSFGGDLMGALDWDLRDTVAISFTDSVNTVNYNHTVANANGTFGGNLTGSGWNVGDTVSLTFSDGITTDTFTRTVAGGDTTSSILNLMATQLDAAFGPLGNDASFTAVPPAPGSTDINFSLAHNRTLSITDFTDDNGSGLANTAQFTAASTNLPTTVASPITANSGAALAFASDTTDNILADLTAQLNAGFAGDATFTLNGEQIEYEMSTNRVLTMGPVGDTRSGDAMVLRLNDPKTVVTTPKGGPPPNTVGTGGEIANFFAVAGDDDITFPGSDNRVGPITIDATNNRINFEEIDAGFTNSGELTAVIPSGTYGGTDMADLSEAIKDAMEYASTNRVGAPFPPILYDVSYDALTGKFSIKEGRGIDGSFGGNYTGALNWAAGDTVTMDLNFGTTTVPVRVATIAPGDNNTLIADKIADALGIGGTSGSAVFEDPAGKITITRNGDNFDFVSTGGLDLTFTNFIDGGTANAGLTLTANVGSTLNSTGFPGSVNIFHGGTEAVNGDPPVLAEVHMLWNTGTDFPSSAAATLGYDETNNTAGSFGGDLMGVQNWDIGDTVGLNFSDGVNTLNYTHTVSAADGSFGGDLVNSGWEAGEDITLKFTDGVNTLNYTRTIGAGDTNAIIYGDIQGQLAVQFGADAAFVVNGTNTGINFTMNTNRTFSISNFSDSGNNNALLSLTSNNLPGSVPAVVSAKDVVLVDFDSDSTGTILTEMEGQLQTAFGDDANFTVNGNLIDFQLNEQRGFTVTGFADDNGSGSGNAADFAVTGNLGLPASGVPAPIITAGGDDARFYGVDDDIGGVATGDSLVPLITISDSNNMIDFKEVDRDGKPTGELSIKIPSKEYTDMDELALAIETEMETLSKSSGYGIDYSVSYDGVTRRFSFRENGTDLGGLELLWGSGKNDDNSAALALGFDRRDTVEAFEETSDAGRVNITLTSANNMIDFKEIPRGELGKPVNELTATIPPGEYNSFDDLTAAVEKAMEEESAARGNNVDYAVSYDGKTQKFTIKENGTTLDGLDLLWQNGTHASDSAASILGFDIADDVNTALMSVEEVKWGIFDTLIDLGEFLGNNDVDGVERTLNRLETHLDHAVSTHADTGFKFNRLEIQEKISLDLNLSLTERRSSIEDADIIAATMDLKAIELAYQAALNSTAKVLSVSLVDFL